MKPKKNKSFIQNLVFNCQSIASAMKDSGSIDENKYLEVLLEHLYLYLNITDRMAFGVMKAEKRDKLMTELEELSISFAVEITCGHWPEEMKNNIYLEAMENFYNAMKEFSQYKRIYEKTEDGVKNTLIWEFCKNIAKLEGQENNIGAIVGREHVVMTALKNIGIKSFIDSVK